MYTILNMVNSKKNCTGKKSTVFFMTFKRRDTGHPYHPRVNDSNQ